MLLACLMFGLSFGQDIAHVPQEEPPNTWPGQAAYQRRTAQNLLSHPHFVGAATGNGALWICGACPGWHPGGDVPHAPVLFLARVPHRAPPSPVPGQLGCFGVGDRQQLSECLTPPLGRVSALLGWECIYNMFCFLCQRQSVRNMVWVSIFLGAFPEKCNIWPLAQGSRAAPVSRAAAGSCVRPRKMLL